jgi:ABC-type antimicrobial peptide transport system permease subunit
VLVLSGVAIGLLLSKETMDWFGPFLSGVDLFSAPFFGSMCIALFAAMALVALVPAIRATQLDPMEVLRAE